MKGRREALEWGAWSAVGTWLVDLALRRSGMVGEIARDFLLHLWPLVVGGIVGLIVWNVQFFRHYKREKDAEFRSWLTAQEANWQQHFNALARRAEDEWEISKSSVRHFCQTNEGRLLRLERAISQKDSDVQPKET